MLLHTGVKRFTSLLLTTAMILGNASSCMTAYAVGQTKPTNPDGTTPNGNKPQDTIHTEGTYVNDTPMRLQISKVKTAEDDHEGIAPKTTDATQKNTITYKISGRVEGAAADLLREYGAENVELAYSSSNTYLGYGWLKGTYEYLVNRQNENLDEEMQILYNSYGVFEGYAYITRTLETADDVNRYVAGAQMVLYDAVEIFRNPEVTTDGEYYGEDDRFTGVTVIRDPGSNNVTSVYVEKGYAGTQTEYVLQKENGTKIEIDENGNVIDDNYNYQDEINDFGDGTWIAKTIQREDTPILFYSLDNLHVTSNDTYVSQASQNNSKLDEVYGTERYNKKQSLYGFDKDGNVVCVDQKDERDFSIYAFEAGTNRPVYEFVGGDFTEIKYSLPDKTIRVGKDTIMYHLNENGNRDAMVDPQTGIAYIEQTINPTEGHDNIHKVNDTDSTNNTKIYVWPVNVFYDGSGDNQGNENGSRTYEKILTTRIATINADTENEYTTGTFDGSAFIKSMNPVLDQYGHPIYYRKSDQSYTKGYDLYDYDGDEYIGYVYKDSLDTENENAYKINRHDSLYNGDPDDPFNQSTHYQYTDKQNVKVTVDVDGNYIVNGKSVVPVPVRDGKVFAGWLVEPNRLSGTGKAVARWQNANGSGMDDTEEAQWYSDRQATGKTETLTIEFDANGGEFRSGSGDIHSTDNVLYRRLGDAYLMENVWTSGENTPNDPLDTQKVDTVENVADNKNTISSDGKTGNDVYSSKTKSGGQADMLKRVPQGVYIMEERNAPMGYVKALPVGVTMNEGTNVQTTEMVDTTIKAEFIKADAPIGYEKELYIDDVLQKNDAGDTITVTDTKGQWYFKHVKGAVLAVKGDDDATKKSLSSWVKVTSNTDITKKQENGSYYFEFASDTPLFLEGIPAGNYVISEVKTPAGFVTMEDQKITITAEDHVQIFGMKDEHTRLEIEKYYSDGTEARHLPNTDKAGLQLVDKEDNVVASWYTDDLSDYTNEINHKVSSSVWSKLFDALAGKSQNKSFVEGFTEKVQNGETDFDTFSWTVDREATKSSSSTEDHEIWAISDGTRYEFSSGNVPDSVPEAFKQAYQKRNLEKDTFTYTETMSATKDDLLSPTLSDQVWNISNGTKMHVSIYPINDGNESGQQMYGVSFGFNYETGYTGEYANMVSYDTIDGIRRFDYIPQGTYTLKEIDTPDGFVTASDIPVTVENTDAVKRYRMENKERQLVIAKIAKKDDAYYTGTVNNNAQTDTNETYAAVIPGAKLKVYYTEEELSDYKTRFYNGTYPEWADLIDSFTSGNDGVYTEAEYKAELIRKDQIGDYRPHVVTNLKNGYYYIVEEASPEYYGTAEVTQIHVTDQSTSDMLTNIQVVDTPLPVAVKVLKKNEEGSPLSGATFSVKNKTLGGIEIGTLTTDSKGEAVLNITDSACFAADGKLQPYTFTINEVSAPAGYTLDTKIHEFTMDSTAENVYAIMVNEKDADISNGVLTVIDTPSELTISKADFRDGSAVPGSKLVIYEAENADGTWKSNGKTLNDTWTWSVKENEKTHSVSGLTAGGTYVICEEEFPAGYTKADDIFFKVSTDGTGIQKIWYDPKENISIDFKTDSTGSVESVTFTTRAVVGTYVVLEDLTDNTEKNLGTLKTGILNLSADNVTDGHRYRATEYVKYTDGSTDKLSATSFIAKLYNNWMQIELNADLTGLSVEITDTDENVIASFTPDKNGSETIANPLKSDPNTLTVVKSLMNKNGVDHAAVQPGKQIRYQISVTEAGQDVILIPTDGLTYLDTDGLEKDSTGNYKGTTEKENEVYTIIAEVNDDATGYINQRVMIGERTYSYLNVIAVNKGEGLFADTAKLVITNSVEGTHLDNENAEFKFRVTLSDENGAPLSGLYDYRTRYTNGVLRAAGQETEFTFTLSGNDFIRINDLPYNAKYSVVQIVTNDYPFVVTSTNAEGATSKTGVSNVLFTNTRNETSERTVFKKNTSYTLTEKLNFAETDPMILTKYGFSFGEKCQIKDITVLNKPTEVWFTKTDWTDCEEVEGATCVLMDEDGNILKDELGNETRWVSGKEPKKFVGTLEAGKTYRYHEEKAPDGYGYSEDIIFTVSEDGTIDKVIMQDKPTVVSFTKEDFAGVEIPGASCELKEVKEDGTTATIDSWVSGTEAHKIEGTLTPGKTYTYHEAGAPNGYTYCEDIVFSLDKNGVVINAHYVNENSETIVYDKDGYPREIVVKTNGDEKTYWNGTEQVELKDGNIVKKDSSVLVEGAKEEIEVVNNVIRMKDAPFTVTLKKTDFAGEEISGALCVLNRVNKDGTATQIDRWVSKEDKDHEMQTELSVETTYRYHEEKAPDGYGYSEDIEFTIDRDGKIETAHYIDKDGNTILYDKGGFPTAIIAKEDGTYEDDGKAVTIDENGDAVDEDGNVIAKGVKKEIAIIDNVVQMKDAPTDITFNKVDSTTGKSLAGAVLQVIDKNGEVVSEWTTDESGTFKSYCKLIAGETYTLYEKETVDGYYYSYDVTFTVNRDGKAQTVEMRNREIKVVTPPEDYPGIDVPKPDGTNPDYQMEKERTTLAPAKDNTKKYGFFKGDLVEYDVTIKNTGSMDLTMDVDDAFENADLFSTPTVRTVKFCVNGSKRQNMEMGSLNSVNGSVVNITIHTGGYAIVTYEAHVLTDTENLSDAAKDDGKGYLNTARTFNVIGKYYELEDTDGDGKGDTEKEVTVTKEDYPDKLGDKSDDANTPVQKPETPENPSYQMDKKRVTEAPAKEGTDKYGFKAGDTVTYEVHITNTGDLPLKMFVTDAYAPEVAKYFTSPVITAIDGEDISSAEGKTGIGYAAARIRIEPGKEAVVTYEATVTAEATERLSWMASDDGRGYLNTAKTFDVRAERTDGTEGTKEDYPQIPDRSDDAHTPVQTPENPDKPGTPDKPDTDKPGETPEPDKKVYPIIWLLKDSVDDPEHILQGGTFQVLSEDKSEVLIDNFEMNGTWQEWDVVLKADHSYWLHEATPPAGYSKAEDVKFTVSHYGEQVEAAMTDKPTDIVLKKVNSATKLPLAGALLQILDSDENVIREWTTDATGQIELRGELIAGKEYILREKETVKGFYYSRDVKFTVNENGDAQTVTMLNRQIKVVNPPDENPPDPVPSGKEPNYEMEKERVTDAPKKSGTEKYGFFKGDIVTYDVTIKNTGTTTLTMDVDDAFEKADLFTTPEIDAVRFYGLTSGRLNSSMGTLNSIDGSKANITLKAGSYAVVTYKAAVLDAAENLSNAAADDGFGYLNTARTYNVSGIYYEYSGKDEDGDGKGDTVTEHPFTKEDYPKELEDKSDDANTPVQKPTEDHPSYSMDKIRTTEASKKDGTVKYGFKIGETVTYDVKIKNTGTMPLTMYVTDEFEPEAKNFFKDLKIAEIKGTDLSGKLEGVGYKIAKIRLEVGEEASVIFTATVTDEAVQRLSNAAVDDGLGYLNTAKTFNVKAEKPDGSEGGSDEYPGIPDKEDDSHTPVQTTENPKEENPDYPTIWLLKHSVNDPSHILSGGTFQVLSEDKSEVLIDAFRMDGVRKEWNYILEADHTYWFREITPPAGYLPAEDVKFTVSHYGEHIEVPMTDQGSKVTFTKEDFAGEEIPGAYCEIKKVNDDGTETVIDAWTSTGTPHVMDSTLVIDTTYRYHEEKSPDGYGYSEDIEFTVDEKGHVKDAHYIDKDGNTILYDKEGYPTTIIVNPDGTYRNGNETVIINKNGDAVGPDGTVQAKGVKEELEVIDNIVRMKDAPTKVRFLKTDKEGNAVSGAKLVVRAENGDVMDAWETDGNPHDIIGKLVVGETYTLEEDTAPAGYYKADPITFTIYNTTDLQMITMVDEPTDIIVKKITTSGAELSGGTFSIIRKDTGETVIPEFELNGNAKLVGKLEGGVTYLFHEIAAPKGYQKASDMEFTVPTSNPGESIVITMTDKKIPSHDGGGNSDHPSITFHKYDGVTMKALSGAEFTIYDPDGKVYKTVKTGDAGYASVTFNRIGTYTYKETKAPDGYVLDDTVYELKVTSSTDEIKQVANYEKPKSITIKKADAETGEGIKGVRFEITDESGKVVYTGTTDDYGFLTFTPGQYGAYAVRETKVPNEYELSDGYITFTVKKTGVEGETTFYNTKKDKPKIPEPGKKGFIGASYNNDKNGYGKGWIDRDGNWHPFYGGSQTGDYYPFAIFAGMLLLSAAGIVIIRKKKGEKHA